MLCLSDIDPHWYYNRETLGPVAAQGERRILLNPAVVKSKGRPKGSFKPVGNNKKAGGSGETSTRRDPSLFEHEAFELPSSTAPARIERDALK
jgi:hypothetical protein